jgi:hypothetical protein
MTDRRLWLVLINLTLLVGALRVFATPDPTVLASALAGLTAVCSLAALGVTVASVIRGRGRR